MDNSIKYIIEKISKTDPLHAKKLMRNLENLDADYAIKCDKFLKKYAQYLQAVNKDMDSGIAYYQQMISDFMYEQLRFMETGKYSSTSFDEVNRRVYNNPEVMEYFMNGLLLSQVLWKHHYKIFSFFINNFKQFGLGVSNYLEVGGGHGLFISEAIEVLGDATNFHLLDISPTSLEISKHFIRNDKVKFILKDIFEFETEQQFDFITMGEVLEHVENPVLLLKKLSSLLSDDGVIFLTTPTNAPSIDHIYLFSSAAEIRDIFQEANLEILKDICVYAEDVPEEKAKELKITMMYGSFLKKIN